MAKLKGITPGILLLWIIFQLTQIAYANAMLPRGIPLGTIVESKYSNSLMVCTKQNLSFLPWLNEILQKAKKIKPNFKIYLYIDETPQRIQKDNQLKEIIAGGIVKIGSCQMEIQQFENFLFPTFYLFDENSKLVYKHTKFVIYDWIFLNEALLSYLNWGSVPAELVEYNFDLHTEFPRLVLKDLQRRETVIDIDKPTLILFSGLLPTESIKEWSLIDLVVRLKKRYSKVDFYILIKNDDLFESEQINLYYKRYKIKGKCPQKVDYQRIIKRNEKLLGLDVPILIDEDRSVWQKIGCPETPTFAFFDKNGVLVDFRCGACFTLEELEKQFIRMLDNCSNE